MRIYILIITMLLFCFAQARADVKNFEYATLGSLRNHPTVGVGMRLCAQGHGIDLSGNTLSIGKSFPVANARALYLLYPAGNHLYVGAGGGAIYEKRDYPKGEVSLDAVMGFQSLTSKGSIWFLQVEAIHPTLKGTDLSGIWPAVRLGLGF